MKRYSMFVEQSESIDEGVYDQFVDYFEDASGSWVRYEDYEAEKSAMCEADSNAVLADVREFIEYYDKIKEVGILWIENKDIAAYSKFIGSIEKLRAHII